MSIHLVEGVAAAVERHLSAVSFSVGSQRFEAASHPDIASFKSGDFVHLLAAQGEEVDTQEVLVLRRNGSDPVYFGPRFGWPWLVLGVALVGVSLISGTFWLLVVPTFLFALHCGFLARRASVHAHFAAELSTALASVSHELVAMPPDAGMHRAGQVALSSSMSSRKSETAHDD